MREFRTYGSVGGLGGQPPRPTRRRPRGLGKLSLRPVTSLYPPLQAEGRAAMVESRFTMQPQQPTVPREVETFYLEMTSPADLRLAHRTVEGFQVERAAIPSPELNRFFYTAVGGDWYWIDRLGWS